MYDACCGPHAAGVSVRCVAGVRAAPTLAVGAVGSTAMTEARRIVAMPLTDLEGAPVNPKSHHEASIEASITRFGYVEAITLDERTGRLVAGHGRLEDLRRREAAGEPPPDGITAHAKKGWLIPVQRGWASKDDAEAEAYLIASNRTTELGGWDEPGFDEMVARIAEQDRTLLATFGADDAGAPDADWGDAMSGLPAGDRPPFVAVTFTLHHQQRAVVDRALAAIGIPANDLSDNRNGNALAAICEQWLEAHDGG